MMIYLLCSLYHCKSVLSADKACIWSICSCQCDSMTVLYQSLQCTYTVSWMCDWIWHAQSIFHSTWPDPTQVCRGNLWKLRQQDVLQAKHSS